jgi:putative addiction module killer protein
MKNLDKKKKTRATKFEKYRVFENMNNPQDIIAECSDGIWIRKLWMNADGSSGNLGVCESVGDGVFELKIDFGPGYRVYFGYKTDKVLILLLGGCKKGQQKDIDKAKEYWHEYLSQKRGKK